jgi:hypothetical protein
MLFNKGVSAHPDISEWCVPPAADWPWSSFSRFVQQGIYDMEWIGDNEGRLGNVGLEMTTVWCGTSIMLKQGDVSV